MVNFKNPPIDVKIWTKLASVHHSITTLPWLAEATALVGGILFLSQTWKYARLLPSVLDEGTYLVKGYLYATGQYQIFQFYGPWSNKMPLSFLIPGIVQKVFGPGLGTGRTLAIVLAGLMLLGIWILAGRMAGRWWATAIVWFFAINPEIIKMYSLAVSQVLIACMLAWTLVLVIGEDRPVWQIALGSLLAGLMGITRFNMLSMLPFVVLYIFWQHGKKLGFFSAGIGIVTIIGGHLFFWPGILQVYALQFPRSITPFLNPWRTQGSYPGVWDPVVTRENQLLSVSQTLRIHFTSSVGLLTAVLLWPKKGSFKPESNKRTAIFLCVLLIALIVSHTWASIFNNYCVYCLPSYFAFYAFIGLLLIALTYPIWRRQIPPWLQIIICLLILFLSILIGFGVYEQLGAQILDVQIPRTILEFPNITSGDVPLGNYLKKNYDFDFKTSRRIATSSLGLIWGVLVLLLALLLRVIYPFLQRRYQQIMRLNAPSYGYWSLLLFLITGTFISPIVNRIVEQETFLCNRNVIGSYHAAGDHLSRLVPAGSKVYWKGGNSAVPLLYIPGIEIYPPQLNGLYTYKYYGDPDDLLKYGWWSVELSEKWLYDADYVLIQQRYYDQWYRQRLHSEQFEELESTPPTTYCEENTHIRVFKRNK